MQDRRIQGILIQLSVRGGDIWISRDGQQLLLRPLIHNGRLLIQRLAAEAQDQPSVVNEGCTAIVKALLHCLKQLPHNCSIRNIALRNAWKRCQHVDVDLNVLDLCIVT